MPVITLKFKDRKIRDYPIAVGQSFTIGRKTANDIVIDNLAVSGTHAKIESVASTFVLRDLESTNGTFVNKEKITLHNLKHRDTIFIGKHELVFDRSDLIKKDTPEQESLDDDKTRILDTSEFRKLTGKEDQQTTTHSEPVRTEKQSIFSRFFNWIFG